MQSATCEKRKSAQPKLQAQVRIAKCVLQGKCAGFCKKGGEKKEKKENEDCLAAALHAHLA